MELLNTNVRVTVVFPGAMRTNITANSGVTINAVSKTEKNQRSITTLEPIKAAQMIVEGMEQNRFRVLVGSDAAFMDFLYRLSPQRAANFIYKQMQSLLAK